ncbi:MAG: MipA/OmpV family protein [Geminicoccaceae bacterium]
MQGTGVSISKKCSSPWLGLAAAAMALSVMVPSIAQAQQWEFSLGAGVGAAPDYEGSNDYEAVPLLLARAEKGNRFVELFGTTLRANLINSPTFTAGPVLNYRFERDDVESNAVDRLDDVDEAIELGGFVGLSAGGWFGRVTLTQDVNDGHDGLLLALLGGYTTSLAPSWTLSTSVSTTYADDDYMDSYFSIDAGDSAASGLDEFDADAGFKDAGVSLRLAWGQGAGWGVTSIASYTRLLDDAEDSPVVDDAGDANQLFGGVALTYAF